MAQYTQRTQPMHSPTATKASNNTAPIQAPYPPEPQNSTLYKILSKPSTSKATDKQGDEQAVKDMELYYKNTDIERQVMDIKRRLRAPVIKKPRISQEESKDSEKIQIISDDDCDIVDIKTETLPMSSDEVDDNRTRSGDEDTNDKIVEDEIHKDGSSISRITISIGSECKTSVKEEPEDNASNEQEVILPNFNIATNLKDPLTVETETVKEEPKDEMAELKDEIADLEDGGADLEDKEADFEDGGADLEDEESELRDIKVESPDNTIEIGETVIQTISSGINYLDNILSNLVEKNFMTQTEKNYLSTIFDMNCVLNVNYKLNDNLKVFAQQIYLCSEEAYNYMANHISCLPSAKYIDETFITLHGAPGFSAEALDCLKMKVKLKKNSNKIFCTLAINDIELKITKACKKYRVAFIITVVALNASWKLPLCYFICSDLMSSKKREQLIQLAISLVERSGVIPKALSYLPIFQNIEMAERLVKNNSKKNMFLSFSGKDMYLIPDPVYIFDKFRICGCEDENGLLISLRHIELLVKHLGRVRPGKVTNRLLGKSLAFSLEVCADDFLSSGLANVQGTVTYLTLINKFLDVLTCGIYWKEAAMGNNVKVRQVLIFLEYFQEYISKISPKYKSNPFWLNNTSREQLKFDTRSLMDVLSMAVHGVHSLLKQRFTDISMKRLTMHSTTYLTNFYHVVDNGELTEKTVKEFTARYKQNLQYMKPQSTKGGNIVSIKNISVLDITSPVQKINITTYLKNSNNVVKNRQFEIDITDDLYKILKFDARGEYINLTKIYIAGYVVYNLVRRLRCDTCISALLRLNQRQEHDPYITELVIKKIEQDSSDKLCVKLMDPSADVVRICNTADVVFKRATLQSNAEKLDILERFNIPLLMLKVKRGMIGKDYFKNLDFHRHDTDIMENHVVELAKAVAEVYLEIRLKYRT